MLTANTLDFKAAGIAGLINDQTTRNESLEIAMRSWSEAIGHIPMLAPSLLKLLSLGPLPAGKGWP
jgi:hypothetical protein